MNALGILHVVAPAREGGAERVLQTLACGQQRAGHDVHVVAVLSGDGAEHPFLTPLRRAGVRLSVLDMPGRAYLRERAAIASICTERRPAVCHTHGYRPDVLDAGVARGLGIPTVTTAHGITGGDWKNRVYERLQRRSFRRFDAVLAVSKALAQRLVRAGVPAARVHVVQNAWDGRADLLLRETARDELGVPVAGFRIGWVGRLTREKGPDVMVRALAHLSDLPVGVSMIGRGRDQNDQQRLAAELGVGDRITWHGAVSDAARVYRAFDVFVLSSRTEGTPMALFEAMAANVPIVATQVGGVPDVVSPAEAVLVPAEEPETLADAIRSVFHSRDVARVRAEAARHTLERRFGLASWLDRHDQLYLNVQRKRSNS